MLVRLCQKLSAELGLEQPLAPNASGAYSLLLEPDLHISLQETPHSTIVLSVPLVALKPTQADEVVLRAMSANLLGRETGKGILALDTSGQQLLFLRLLPSQVVYRDFYEGIEDFANYAESWKQEIAAIFEPKTE